MMKDCLLGQRQPATLQHSLFPFSFLSSEKLLQGEMPERRRRRRKRRRRKRRRRRRNYVSSNVRVGEEQFVKLQHRGNKHPASLRKEKRTEAEKDDSYF